MHGSRHAYKPATCRRQDTPHTGSIVGRDNLVDVHLGILIRQSDKSTMAESGGGSGYVLKSGDDLRDSQHQNLQRTPWALR